VKCVQFIPSSDTKVLHPGAGGVMAATRVLARVGNLERRTNLEKKEKETGVQFISFYNPTRYKTLLL
jgi:hypothetical protein